MTCGVALVTGANGFLGRHVTARLVALGFRVATIGRTRPAGIASDAAFLLPEFGDATSIGAVMKQVSPNLVLHLAGTTTTEPVAEAYHVNTIFAANLLDAARRMPVAPRVLLAGSAAEYGQIEVGDLPVAETVCCRPVSVYGITKLSQTLHGLAAAGFGIPVVVARLFNVVGAGMPAHLALGAFAEQIRIMPATGGVLRTGRLDRERDFVEVVPAAAVLVDLVQDPAASGQVINVCSGQPQSLELFVEAMLARTAKPVTHEYDAIRGGNSDAVRHWGAAGRLAALGHRLEPADPMRVACSLVG